MPPPSTNGCWNCSYFKATPELSPLTPTWGECTRFPPQYGDVKPYDPLIRLCGEWKRA